MSVIWGINQGAHVRSGHLQPVTFAEHRRRALRRAGRIAVLRSLIIFLIGFTVRSVSLHASDRLIDPAVGLLLGLSAILLYEKRRGMLR